MGDWELPNLMIRLTILWIRLKRKHWVRTQDYQFNTWVTWSRMRSFRQRSFRKRLWPVHKRVEVSSQTFRSQFTNVINIDMSTCVLTVQFRILTLCVNYWVWNFTLQTFTCQPGFNYTIQNTTLFTRCMRKLLDVNSHSLFPAKVYFLIKWTDKWIGYKQTACDNEIIWSWSSGENRTFVT